MTLKEVVSLKQIASVVGEFTPLLASAISETNPLVGLILTALAHVFGSTSDPSDLLDKINSTPDKAIQLQKLELEHKDVLLQNQVNDRESAREREEEIVKITGKRDGILDFIAITVIFGFFGLCLVNYFIELDDDHVVTMLIGQLSTAFLMVLSFYFGSSNK